MALSYLLPQDQLSFEDLLTTVDAHPAQTFADAQNFEALFGNVFNSQILHQQLAAAAAAQQDLFAAALAHQSQGAQEMIDFSNYVAPGAFAHDCCDGNTFVGSESPNGSDATVCDSNHSNPFAALVIPSDKAAASAHQSPLMQPFQLFPAVNAKPQSPVFGAPHSPAASPPLQGARQPAKRQHRAPTVTWQAAPGRAPTSTVSTPGSFSPATVSMPSPPLSPTTSVKDEAIACAPSPVAVVSERTSTGGIKTPFDDMADEDLDDLDEDQIMGMMGKLQAKGAAPSDGPTKEKKKRKRRTTAELAPQELEVRRIKNSEAARRCRLRKTLKLRWLEARCTELEETNVKLMSRLSELEARMPKP